MRSITFLFLLTIAPFALQANTFGTTGALLAAQTATNQLDISWTPQWSNLKAYYRMDGKTGTIAASAIIHDLFGTSNGTTSASGLSYAVGKLEQGLTFTTSSSVTIPRTSPANVCTNSTIMMWVKWNATTSNWWTSIAGNFNQNSCTDAGWYFQQHSNTKKIEITINTSGNNNQSDYSTGDVLDGTWHHVAITIASSQMLMYVDGTLDKTISIIMGTGVCSPTAPISFGSTMCADPLPSPAMLDEIAIFNSILTASDILTIYNRQKNGVR
ncbi:LamG domain-containing protein [Bdellovibrio sp. HCB209]|uniref:LamG domain-containing protein n=1 Tax=Bdellovibrio sp. HCB209 TaxID=3394354 RepID=UPI0039B3C279